jgi:hypothetical protein
MTVARKILPNFHPRAARVLGLAGYARLIAAAVLALPEIFRTRTLQRVDALMGRRPIQVRFHRHEFVLDAPYCDTRTRGTADDSFTFGSVRELYIRNSYLPLPDQLGAVRFAMDCGANRGVFSALLTEVADRVVAVEANPFYSAMIPQNAPDAIIDTGFVGAGGELAQVGASVTELADRHGLPQIDLLKLDIEGSEFALFEGDLEWLDIVQRLTMEVHSDFGHPSGVVRALHAHGFETILRDEYLRPSGEIVFIYAHKRAVTAPH